MRERLSLTIALAGLAICGSSFGASFDCNHAAAPREKLICSDPTLSDLDGKLGRLYQERRALLTPHGDELLQASERSWLHYVATVCPLVAPDTADRRRQPKACLEREYRDRLKQLPDVGQRVGPFLFNRIDIFAAAPAPDENGFTHGFYVWHVGYPQVDGPSTSQADALNKQISKSLTTEDNCDEDTNYVIGYAVPRFISLQWNSSEYCHTAAHGRGGSLVQNMVLQPTLRPATARDFFGPTGGWVTKLQQLFWDALIGSGWRPSESIADSVKRDIGSLVIQPDRWLFTANGLNVTFSFYEGGCYACTPEPMTVPWSKVKPLLSRDSIVQ